MKNILLLPLLIFVTFSHSSAQTKSRLVAESMYTYNGTKFYLTDTTHYTYYMPYVGGDLSSKYIPFNDKVKYAFDTGLIKLDKLARTLQTFDALNHRALKALYSWNAFLGIWEENSQDIYNTSVLDSINTLTQQNWESSSLSWLNTFKQNYTYDASNNRTSYLIEVWNNSTHTWENSEKTIYSYDVANNMIKRFYQTWDVSLAAWENSFYDTMTYSPTNKQTSIITKVWDKTLLTWKNNRKLTSSYSSADFLEVVLDQGWDAAAGLWYNYQKTTYTNDARGNNTEWVVQNWDASTSSWLNFRKKLSLFDAKDNEINYVLQYWDNTTNSFENGEQLTHTYDARNNMLTEVSSLWRPATSEWDSSELDEFQYNSYDQLTDFVYYTIWDKATGKFLSNLEDQFFHYYYEEYTTTIDEKLLEKGELKMYPIPASNSFTLNLKWEETQAFNVQIIDNNGRLLSEWNVAPSKEYSERINTQNFAPSTYFIKIKGSKEGSISRSFTVIH